MKIIARTDGGFLLEATGNEIAELNGFGSTREMERIHSAVRVGGDVPVEKLNSTSKYLRGVNIKSLDVVIEDLNRAINNVNKAKETIDGINIFETIKEVTLG